MIGALSSGFFLQGKLQLRSFRLLHARGNGGVRSIASARIVCGVTPSSLKTAVRFAFLSVPSRLSVASSLFFSFFGFSVASFLWQWLFPVAHCQVATVTSTHCCFSSDHPLLLPQLFLLALPSH